jgi:hypothetical protein
LRTFQAKAQLERARAVQLEELDVRPHRRTVAVTGSVETVLHSEYSVYDTSFRDSFDGDLLRLVRVLLQDVLYRHVWS